MIKTIKTLFIITISLLIMSSCQKKSKDNPPNKTTTKNQNSDNLNIFLQNKDENEIFQAIIDNFEDNYPNIKVNLHTEQNEQTDIIILSSPNDYLQNLEKNEFVDLSNNDFMKKSNSSLNHYVKNSSFITNINYYGIIINTDILALNNLHTPNSWDELLETFDTLKKQ